MPKKLVIQKPMSLKQSRNLPPDKHHENVMKSSFACLSVNIHHSNLCLLRLSKTEQEQLDLALQLSKKTASNNEISIELPIISDEKESTTSQSTVSSNGRNQHLPRAHDIHFAVQKVQQE